MSSIRDITFDTVTPSGQRFDIATPEGATTFIGDGQKPIISINLEQTGLRQMALALAKGQMSGNAKKQQTRDMQFQYYLMIGCLADAAPPEVFARLPSRELACLVRHMSEVLEALAHPGQPWSRTGQFQPHQKEMLNVIVVACKHVSFVDQMFDFEKGRLLKALAGLAKSRAGVVEGSVVEENLHLMPETKVCESIRCIMGNIYITSTNRGWSSEKTFRKLEAAGGFLAQVLRCFTVLYPDPDPYGPDRDKPRPTEHTEQDLYLLTSLAECLQLLKSKFNPNMPSGKVLKDIVEGKSGDPSAYNRRLTDPAMLRMASMQRLATAMKEADPGTGPESCVSVRHMCRNCNKIPGADERLLRCARCESAFYCNRECQVADWKSHKPICKSQARIQKDLGTNNLKRLKNIESSLIMSFAKKNYFRIMRKLGECMEEFSVSKKELVLSVSFFGESGTIAPGLREPAEFEIFPVSQLMEGSRPKEPVDWLNPRGTSKKQLEQNLAGWREGLADQYRRMTDDRLFVIVLNPDGQPGIQRIALQQENGDLMFTDEALKNVQLADAFASILASIPPGGALR